MEYLVGIAIAVVVAAMGSLAGLDRERGYYSVVLIVIATYYILFAAQAAAWNAAIAESLPMVMFTLLAILGFKLNPWYIVGGLAAHGVFDAMHATIISNPGVPAWWPGFCLAFDLAAAIYLALLLRTRKSNHVV